MNSTTDHSHKGHHQPVHPPTDARGSEGPLYVTPEMEDSFEEIEHGSARPARMWRARRLDSACHDHDTTHGGLRLAACGGTDPS
jgi:hypothetical protein